MKMTVIFEPDDSVAITVVRDEPDYAANRVAPAMVPNLMGVYRALVDECVDRAMELGFAQ